VTNTWIYALPAAGAAAAGGLLYAYKKGSRRLVWIFKPAASLLFVLTGIAGGSGGSYPVLIVTGLCLAMAGDILLIPQNKKAFLGGLISFLMGHVLYAAGFATLLSNASVSYPALIGILGIGVVVVACLWKHLGNMKVPVIAYVLVISTMLWLSWMVFFRAGVNDNAGVLIAVGATCFYISDLAVAIDRFVGEGFANKAWGIPLYYAGQFLIALSISAVRNI